MSSSSEESCGRWGISVPAVASSSSAGYVYGGPSSSSGECATIACVVRRMGLPCRPLPSLVGLPGAPSGNCELMPFGTRKVQLLHESSSESDPTLSRLNDSRLPCEESGGPKYALDAALVDCGLVGGELKGEYNNGAVALEKPGDRGGSQ
jgi:hypothetical protein